MLFVFNSKLTYFFKLNLLFFISTTTFINNLTYEKIFESKTTRRLRKNT